MKKKEQGRSTLEIIGVLGVLVFLTIGGLQVYSAVQSSLISAHLEEEVLKEATIKKHENAKADDTDAHEVSHQGAHNTTITSQNGTEGEGTKQDWFWVTISDIDVTAEQKACQKLLTSPKIKEQEWLGLMAIEVNGEIVENCPEEIQKITYYFQKRKTLNLEDILLPNCQNTICPTYATCVKGQITTCKAGYKIISNGCQCKKCTGRVFCDGKTEQACPYGTKPNGDNTKCIDCVVGEKDCDCSPNSECAPGFVCKNNICTCEDQAPCPSCKDPGKKCWNEATQQCIPCSNPSNFTTQDTCEQNDFKWCLGNETCVEKETPCSCSCELSPDICRTLGMNFNPCCKVCDEETGLWKPAEDGFMRCVDGTHIDTNTGITTRWYGNVACYNGETERAHFYHGNQQECEKYGFYWLAGPEIEYKFDVAGLCLNKKELVDAFYYSSTSDNGEVRNLGFCYTEKGVIFHEDDQNIHLYRELQPRPHTGKKIGGIPDARGVCCKENEEIYCDATNEDGECKKWLCCAKGKSTCTCPEGEHWNGSSCVECVEDTDCTSGEVCDTTTNTCVQCTDNADCSGGQVCNTASNTCVECAEDSDCTGGKTCDTTTNTCSCPTDKHWNGQACVECMNDENCSDGQVCNTDNTCVECTEDSHCSADGKVCNTANNTCVECTEHTDCSGGQVCNAENICACPDDTPAWNDQACVECAEDSDCTGGKACDTTTNTCSCPASTPVWNETACVTCAEADATKPNWNGSSCVECTEDSHCSADGKVCNTANNTCVECTKDENCSGGQVCNTENNTCVECLKHEDCGPGKRCTEGQCSNCYDSQGCGCTFNVCSDGEGGCETPSKTCKRMKGQFRVGTDGYYCDIGVNGLVPLSKADDRVTCPITIW